MSGNFYEVELRKVLHVAMVSKHIREEGDSTPFFEKLMGAYPVSGSKIDWGSVPGSIERTEEDKALQLNQFLAFFDEVAQKAGLLGDVVYVGDSATDFALVGSIECIREALSELLVIPQHHYLIGSDSSWCMCFTMEGDMGFGFRPSRIKSH